MQYGWIIEVMILADLVGELTSTASLKKTKSKGEVVRGSQLYLVMLWNGGSLLQSQHSRG